jgi:aldose 1-epimerase
LPLQPFAGLALEPQNWPDAPNRSGFPSALLRAGEVYRQITRYRISMAET